MTAPARPNGRLVNEFGTGLLHTRVTLLGDGRHQWWRSPGPYAPSPFQAVSPPLAATLATIDRVGQHRLVVGQRDAAGRTYLVGGTTSIAHRLLAEGPQPDLATMLYGLGQLLAALHATPRPAGVADGSRALNRLSAWLAGAAARPAAGKAAHVLQDRLGGRRWQALRESCDDALTDPVVTLAHGAPGLGSVVVAERSGAAELLTGEDVCVAPWWTDLAWPAGELVELRSFTGGRAEGQPWQRLLAALYAGYGRDPGPRWASHAAMRVALHLHDFTAYVGWDARHVEQYAALLARLTDIGP